MFKYNFQITILHMLTFMTIYNHSAYGAQKCDLNKPETAPSNRFEINSENGTVYDSKASLTWKICAEGRVYRNGHCLGNTKFTWIDSNRIVNDQLSGWRLPSIDELMSVEEKCCKKPSINLKVFPDMRSLSFWSAKV